MINMIRADLYRIFKNKVIFIAFLVMLTSIAMCVYNISGGSIGSARVGGISTSDFSVGENDGFEDYSYEEIQEMSMAEYREIMITKSNSKLDKNILASNINMYYVFIFVIALAITVDFSAGSVKNTLSSATSRRKYFLSKVVVVNVLCLVFFFINTYIAYYSNIIFNSKNLASSIADVTKITVMQLPTALTLVSILSGIAFLTRKTAVYNVVCIPFIMVFQLILGMLFNIFSIKEEYAYYELQLMFGKLANDPSKDYVISAYLLCFVIMLLCYLTGWLSFKKSEIK